MPRAALQGGYRGLQRDTLGHVIADLEVTLVHAHTGFAGTYIETRLIASMPQQQGVAREEIEAVGVLQKAHGLGNDSAAAYWAAAPGPRRTCEDRFRHSGSRLAAANASRRQSRRAPDRQSMTCR